MNERNGTIESNLNRIERWEVYLKMAMAKGIR